MEDAHERRDEALTLLNNERKRQRLKFTLELSKEREKEFKKVAAGVDLDALMQIEHMVHPIPEEDLMDMVLDKGDLAPASREVPVGVFRSKKGGERHIRRGKKKSKRFVASENNRGELTPCHLLLHYLCLTDTIELTGTPQPPATPWKRPVPLPFVEPPPPSSKPAELTSNYVDMFSAIGRPEPQEQHVWAKSRTDLCETAPYFRQAQGGIHLDKQTRMIGYLL
jgi:hypothetical protein